MTQKKYVLTEEHRAQLKPWADKWIANAMSTKPMLDEDREVCRKAVVDLYAAAGLKAPRVIFVPSPFVGTFAAGFASAIWHKRKTGFESADATTAATYAATTAATRAATRDATNAATYAATTAATRAATDAATRAATYAATTDATADATDAATADATRAATTAATHAATDAATRAATDAATNADLDKWFLFDGNMPALAADLGVGSFGLECAQLAWKFRSGGNQWSGYDSFLSFFRHVAKLPLDYSKWDAWETLSLHSGPRWVSEEFCIISDRPTHLTVDERNRPHNETGPFCRWSDGSELYSWHGTRVPSKWILNKSDMDPTLALTHPQIEERRAAAEIIGWKKVLASVQSKVVDKDPDPEIGTLLQVDLPDSPDSRFLQVRCGTGRDFVLPVPSEMRTALEANAWTYGLDPKDLKLEART